MSAFLLLTARDCRLCAHGRVVLDALAAEGLLEWREVAADSVEGRKLAATAPPLRPVLYDDHDRTVAYGRFSAKRLRRSLTVAA